MLSHVKIRKKRLKLYTVFSSLLSSSQMKWSPIQSHCNTWQHAPSTQRAAAAVLILSSVLSCCPRLPCWVNKLSACSACTRRCGVLLRKECTGCTVKVREQNQTAATAAFLSFYYGGVVALTTWTQLDSALYVLFKRRTFVLPSVLPELAPHHTETKPASLSLAACCGCHSACSPVTSSKSLNICKNKVKNL